jgi:HSP20 family molecular chaperone IbpA
MRISRIPDRGKGMEGSGDLHEEDDRQVLVLVLKELLERLGGAFEEGVESGAGEVEGWEGEGYFYLEASLPGTPVADIDVNIQAGRAFIRMAR